MKNKGYTLVELVMGAAIMAIVCGSFAGFLRYVMISTTSLVSHAQADDEARRVLAKLQERLSHASEIRVASSTLVQYVSDIDQSPLYNPDGDIDGDGVPNFRDGDRDGDAASLTSAAAQWRIGFNLKDDDEDGDGNIDMQERLYFSSGTLWWDCSRNQAAWGGAELRKIGVRVSTFSLTYFGNKANPLGRNVDLNNDGVIAASEIDAATPATGLGNNDGALDSSGEMSYLTEVRIDVGFDWNKDGKTEYKVQTDAYPPLLPVKGQSF